MTQMPKEIWLIEQPDLDEDDDHRIIWSTDPDVYPEGIKTRYVLPTIADAAIAYINSRQVTEAHTQEIVTYSQEKLEALYKAVTGAA